MLFWNVPAPDQALLISGSRHKDPSTQFRIVTGHGGGFGDPKDRTHEAIRRDLRDGYITPAQAAQDYGFVA